MLAECHASKKRKIYWQIFMCKRKEKLLTKCHASKKGKTADTARKIKIPKSWNIMKNSKIPRKYQLSVNFLDQRKTVFPTSEKFKTRTFSYSKNMVFYIEENIILHQLFESKECRICHLRKVQNKIFSVFRKHGTPYWRKYHLTSTF